MVKEIKQLKKNLQNLSKDNILLSIREISSDLNLRENLKDLQKFAEFLFEVLEAFSKREDIDSEIIIMEQLVELAWWGERDDKIMDILSKAVILVLMDSQVLRGDKRLNLYKFFIEMAFRFPQSEKIQDIVTKAAVDLIHWGNDQEILEIKATIREIAGMHPMMESLFVLATRVYMNAFFYLMEQDCNAIITLYQEFSCFSLSTLKGNERFSCPISNPIKEGWFEELLQEGMINAIINLARNSRRLEEKQEDAKICLDGIRSILIDSEKILRKSRKNLYKDLFRLVYAFDQFELWEEFSDIPIISELKEERERDLASKAAQTKLLAIRKNMRIEEYDSRKILRRGIKLAYDLEDPNEVRRFLKDLVRQQKDKTFLVDLVEEVDAIVESERSFITKYLRSTGQIPSDKLTISELQDLTSISDDLMAPATREDRIVEQINFLRKIRLEQKGHLVNETMLVEALIFSVAMHGFNSPKLAIKTKEVSELIENMYRRKMMVELIGPLFRAITLRAARLDAKSTEVLLQLLTGFGLKHLKSSYRQYAFTKNLARLMSYLGRTGQIDQLKIIKSEVEKANRLYLENETIPLWIAQALNEAILTFTVADREKELELLRLLKELAKVHSFDEKIQIEYAKGMNYAIFNFSFTDIKISTAITERLIEFGRSYRSNHNIQAKVALGIIISMIQSKINKQQEEFNRCRIEIDSIAQRDTDNDYIQQIKDLSEEILEEIMENEKVT